MQIGWWNLEAAEGHSQGRHHHRQCILKLLSGPASNPWPSFQVALLLGLSGYERYEWKQVTADTASDPHKLPTESHQ